MGRVVCSLDLSRVCRTLVLPAARAHRSGTQSEFRCLRIFVYLSKNTARDRNEEMIQGKKLSELPSACDTLGLPFGHVLVSVVLCAH